MADQVYLLQLATGNNDSPGPDIEPTENGE